MRNRQLQEDSGFYVVELIVFFPSDLCCPGYDVLHAYITLMLRFQRLQSQRECYWSNSLLPMTLRFVIFFT